MENCVKYKKIGLILLSPVIVFLTNALIATIFNLGTYTGTVIRYLFNNIIC